MKVTFKTISGRTEVVDIDPEMTINEVIEAVMEKFHFKGQEIKLIYGGKPIDPDGHFKDINYEEGKFIVLSETKIKAPEPPQQPQQQQQESQPSNQQQQQAESIEQPQTNQQQPPEEQQANQQQQQLEQKNNNSDKQSQNKQTSEEQKNKSDQQTELEKQINEKENNKKEYNEDLQAREQQFRDIPEDAGGLLRAFIRKEYLKNRYKDDK